MFFLIEQEDEDPIKLIGKITAYLIMVKNQEIERSNSREKNQSQ